MKHLGRYAFWLAYPGIWLILRFSVRTRVLVVVGDEFLVVQNWLGSRQWALPGGGAHKGEDLPEAASRELFEEVGIQVAATDLQSQGLFRSRAHGFRYNYERFVLVLPAKPQLKLQVSEISDTAWFDSRNLPATGLDSEVLTAVRGWWQ